MKVFISTSLLIVFVLFVFILTGCQTSSISSEKQMSQVKIDRWEMTPAGVYVPRYDYAR
jgi:hypothetical protein